MLACPSCGEDNPARSRFCWSCGTALATSPSAQGEERKIVSVLFVDLVGFTNRSDQADPEDVRATLRPYHAKVRSEIERFGGTVEKFVGDAVMAVFGAPVAHEDDAERAVRAALRVLDEVELEVRAAVNTGEAVVTLGSRPAEGEGIVAGDVVNTAARLQAAAPVGGLVVGGTTYRTTRHLFDYEELEPVSVKGKTDPVELWRVLGARSRFGADVAERPTTPFLGRDDDLALLSSTYVRTLRESSIQLVTVVGEPGVGKSRLVTELREWVDARPEIVFWRQGRCLPYGDGVTYWALGDIVKAQAGILDSDGPTAVTAKLDGALEPVSDPSEREWLKSRLAPLVGVGGRVPGAVADRDEAFGAWRAFLETLATQRPLILVFEDLHWADDALLDFIEYLIDWSTDVPMLIICTARPELYEQHPGWGGGKRNSTTISLSPLSSEDTARLLATLLDQAVLPAETQAVLLERAGGNPLYAEEFVRMLTDRGLLTRQRLAAVGQIPVPETVQALIAARLDTLAPERKALLHDASVVGKVFWSGAIAAIGGVGEPAVREGLHELARKELVRPSRASAVRDQAEYAFWHALVRDVAYGQIPRPARAEKHVAAAAWIEGIAEDRVGDHAEVLAHHYEQALQLSRAAGDDARAAELEPPTRRFLVLAGDRAANLDAAKARAYYDRALEHFDPDDPDRARVLVKRAEFWDLRDAERDLDEAIAVLRKREGELAAAGALLQRGHVAWLRGDSALSLAIEAEVAALLEQHPPGPELALAYARQAGRHMLAGRARECLELAERALPLARELGLVRYVARLLQFRGVARFELGEQGGMDDLNEGLRLAQEEGLAHEGSTGYMNLASATWELEGPAAALAIYDEAIEFLRRRGMVGSVNWARAETTWPLYDLGRWDDLLRAADTVLDFDRAQGGSQHGLIVAPYKAIVLLARGDASSAAAIVDEILPRARAAVDPQVLAPALAAAALARVAVGEPAAGVELVAELEETFRGQGTWNSGRFLPELTAISLGGDADELADRLVSGLLVVGPRTANSVKAARALLAEAEGDDEEALAIWEEVSQGWESYGNVPGQGRALLGAGRCLVALGRDAREQLLSAQEVFRSLGAASWLAEVEALLGDEQRDARTAP